MRTSTRRALSLGYLALLAACLVLSVACPVSLQKANTVVEAANGLPALGGESALDVREVVSSIPLQQNEERMVWEVDPDAKYRKTILDGEGNCSNLVFGLARYLDRAGTDFQIIHLLKPRRFLAGVGHTVIRAPYRLESEERVGIVDVFAGGLPRSGERFLDAPDLAAPIEDFSFLTWNGRPERAMRFYREWSGRVDIGWIPASELARYFRFLEHVYIPLGSPRIEKYLYDGIALLLGYYPRIFVEDLDGIRAANPLSWHGFQAVLWVFRSSVIVVPLLVWLEWRERLQRAGGVHTPSRFS